MNRQVLINRLEIANRKYKLPLKQRLIKYPLQSFRDIFITVIFGRLLKNKIYFKVKARTFFDENFWCVFPSWKDVYYYGAYVWLEPEYRLTKFIIKNDFGVKPVFFDIGASYGWYSLLFSKLYPNAKIFAFEPSPNVLEILNLNKRYNIEIIPKAVSEKSGTANFLALSLPESGLSTLKYNHNNKIENNVILVEIISLDDFCKEHNIFPDFIKIDIEGAEYDCLKGGTYLLKNNSPIIVMEVYFGELFEKYKEAVFLLKELGYSVFKINEEGELEKLCYNNLNEYFEFLRNKFITINNLAQYDNLIFKKI